MQPTRSFRQLALGFALALGTLCAIAATLWPSPNTFTGAIASSGTNTWSGTNTFSGAVIQSGSVALTPMALTCVTGSNTNLDLSAGTLFYIAGPTGAFSIHGIRAVPSGRWKTILNTNAYALTLANASATESNAANRVFTQVSSNLVSSSNCAFTVVYNATAARWEVLSSAGQFAH